MQHRQGRLCGSQDTIRFWPLAVTMLGMSFRDPLVVSRVVRQVNTFSTPFRHCPEHSAALASVAAASLSPHCTACLWCAAAPAASKLLPRNLPPAMRHPAFDCRSACLSRKLSRRSRWARAHCWRGCATTLRWRPSRCCTRWPGGGPPNHAPSGCGAGPKPGHGVLARWEWR